MLNVLQKAAASFEMKALPLSVRREIPLSKPKRATTWSNNADATVSAVQSLVAMSSGYMDVLSIITSMYLKPLDSGNGPWKSRCQRVQGAGTGSEVSGTLPTPTGCFDT